MSNKKSEKHTPAAAQKMKDFLNRIRQKLTVLPVPRAALNEALQEYARRQGISNFTVESGLNLQQQMRAYERAIENRRQMLLDMAQTDVPAVKGKNFAPQRRVSRIWEYRCAWWPPIL
uniref:Uncharacterized protein n=1 Tax=Romanomermis culicivorax TaxID=13658 RepID=A0A915JZR2_ROMCU